MSKIDRSLRAAGLAGVLMSSAGAFAAEDYQVRAWAASCAGCHGTGGASVGGMPAIAGQDREKLLTALKEFKEGVRPATVMHQHAKGYTDEELALLASYFASQRP
ncbi:MAG TPA: c-type cytochrome [Rhodocyclaceae bacterium]|nr:c-type cytochrome [Zoogloeaceae bacterium]HRD34756.1 c-type cytochrome [Rhodocyclaceae bacterium]